MNFAEMKIGKQILNDGTEIFVPYTKDKDGDIVPYEPYYTIREAMQWILDQKPLLPLKTLNGVAKRMQCPQMRLEALQFIAETDMVNEEIAQAIIRIGELDTEMNTTLTIYPHRAEIEIYGEFYDKVCGIFGDSIQPSGMIANYRYQIVEGFAKGGFRLKAYQQRVGSYLHRGCHEPLSGDLNIYTIMKYLREHHQIG